MSSSVVRAGNVAYLTAFCSCCLLITNWTKLESMYQFEIARHGLVACIHVVLLRT
jgi:hypothetical protein